MRAQNRTKNRTNTPKKPRKNRRIQAKKNPSLTVKQGMGAVTKRLLPFVAQCAVLIRLGFLKLRVFVASQNIGSVLQKGMGTAKHWTGHTGAPACKRGTLFVIAKLRQAFSARNRTYVQTKIQQARSAVVSLVRIISQRNVSKHNVQVAEETTFDEPTFDEPTVQTSPSTEGASNQGVVDKLVSKVRKIKEITPARLAHFFDPRVVRTEEPSKFMLHSVMISLLITGMAVTAVAVAASAKNVSIPFSTQSDSEENEIEAQSETVTLEELNEDRSQWLGQSNNSDDGSNEKTAPKPIQKKGSVAAKTAALPSDFFNPIYVFTQAEAKSVSAYPLASPPGVVINIQGIEEPDESAEDMVGEDNRILKVKRRLTKGGLRYIIRLSHPVKKIESHMEGNVITVNPLQ